MCGRRFPGCLLTKEVWHFSDVARVGPWFKNCPKPRLIDGLEEVIRLIESGETGRGEGEQKFMSFLKTHKQQFHSFHIHGWAPMMSAINSQSNALISSLPVSKDSLVNALALARLTDNREAAIKILSSASNTT